VVIGPGMGETELFRPLPADPRLAPGMLGKDEHSDSERE